METINRSLIGITLFVMTLSSGAYGKGSNFLDTLQTYCERSNFNNTPTYSQTIEFCQKLANNSSMVTYSTIGKSPQGRDIPLLTVDKEGFNSIDSIRARGRTIILIQACIHAGEPDGKDAGLIFIRDIITKNLVNKELEKTSILFIPIINVDGHEDFGEHYRINQNGPKEVGARFTAQKINMNRDFIKADAPEMRAFLKLYNRVMPELFIDIHVTNGADFQYVTTYGMDGAGYLSEPLLSFSKQLFEKELCNNMKQEGYPLFQYFDYKEWGDTDKGIFPSLFAPQYSNGYASANNRLGLLVENHIYKPYKSRVESTYNILVNCTKIVSRHKDEIQNLIAKCEERWSNTKSAGNDLTLSYKANLSDSTTIPYLAWEKHTKKSALSGGTYTYYDHTKPVDTHVKIFPKSSPDKVITIPEYYIVPSHLAFIAELLDLHGIEYKINKTPASISANCYRFDSYKWSPTPYEGRNTLTTTYHETIEEVRIENGDYIIPTNQPKIKIIAHLLEPDAPSSLLYWGFLNAYIKAPTEFWISLNYMETKAPEMLESDPNLRKEFYDLLQKDTTFAKDPQAILSFFHKKVRQKAEPNSNRYPIFRYTKDRQ